MMTRTIAVTALSLLLAGQASAQRLAPDESQPPANEPYITGTGETVPNPGKSQSGGTTKLDRGIQREDNKIDRSICKGC